MQEKWLTVIQPATKWYHIDFKGIWQYRDLLVLFVKRNFKVFYQQTILGPLWVLLNPLLTTVMYSLVFGNIAKISTDGTPQILFYLLGTTVWGLFSSTVNSSSNTFWENRNIFSKVYFARLVLPLASAVSNFFTFLIQLAMFLVFWVYYLVQGQVAPNLWLLLFPLLTLQTMLLGFGCGLIVASLTTKYRDLQVAVGFGLQLMMYATPVVYPLSQTGSFFSTLLMLNPMTAMVETFRYAFLGSGDLLGWSLLISFGETLILLFLGLLAFSRIEKNFVDTV